jgi:hypothetical protein
MQSIVDDYSTLVNLRSFERYLTYEKTKDGYLFNIRYGCRGWNGNYRLTQFIP